MSTLEAKVIVRRPDGFTLEVDLEAPAGTTTALLGPNGAGKSTVVSAIAGLLPIDDGRIALDGTVWDVPREGVYIPAERRGVGVVFQDYLLFPRMTVVENVAFGLRARGVPRVDASKKAEEWLVRLGLEGLEGRYPGELSGGQAQRVALARALVIEPEVLLLDEPLSALDVSTRAELQGTLAEHLEAFRGPRLLITHDPAEAFLFADTIYVIEDGRLTHSGTADDIRLSPKTRYAADLAGVNLVRGTAISGVVEVGGLKLHLADPMVTGEVLATIEPAAISIHLVFPEGSPRNVWQTRVERLEPLGSRVRLRLGGPLPLIAEVTEAATSALGLVAGTDVWVSVKATEIGVQPAR